MSSRAGSSRGRSSSAPRWEEGRLPVLSGLKDGEPVVVSGQFLLDGERKVKEADLRNVDARPTRRPDDDDVHGRNAMIGKIIEFSVQNKFLMLLLTAVLVAADCIRSTRSGWMPSPTCRDVQVIVFTEYPGQAPRVVEDQITYPLTTTMLAVPYAKVVRGYSFFGFSFVYIIFEDGTDIYWARSRVLEYLSFVANKLPEGVTPRLGPDATGVGWVYEYSLVSGWYCPDHP